MKKVIELNGVWVEHETQVVLKDICLSLGQNVLLGIIGPNGGGKTTLLKVILGLSCPARGEVKVFGKNPREVRKQIGYVPQRGLFDRDFPITVWEVVLMGRLPQKPIFSDYTENDTTLTGEALKTVGMLDLKDRQIGELSEGERQRVLIARALVIQPKLLLLDEPTASIDQKVQTGLYELLDRLKEKMTIVLISHDIGVISTHVDKIACLNVQLFFHDSKEIRKEDLEATYQCPIDLIGHGVPHRVVNEHARDHAH